MTVDTDHHNLNRSSPALKTRAAIWGKTGDLIIDAKGRTYQIGWFNRKKVFGFVRNVGTREDVFIHIKRRSPSPPGSTPCCNPKYQSMNSTTLRRPNRFC